MKNQDIRYTAVWDVIQKLGTKIKQKEERKIQLNKNGQLKLNSKKALESLDCVKNLLIKYNSNPEEFKKLTELYNYLVNNKQGLIPYYLRENINIPKPEEGIEYRTLGTMEHNICDVLAQRMKHRKMTWTINGANNLAKILAEKASRRIYSLISEFCDEVISKEKLNKITEMITLTAADVNKKPKQSNVYPIYKASIPFTGYAMNNARKVISHFVEGKYFNL